MHHLRLVAALILAACSPSAAPAEIEPKGGCLNFCTSNAECKQFGGTCVFCNQGRCLQRPIDPIAPGDAGVDAPPDANG